MISVGLVKDRKIRLQQKQKSRQTGSKITYIRMKQGGFVFSFVTLCTILSSKFSINFAKKIEFDPLHSRNPQKKSIYDLFQFFLILILKLRHTMNDMNVPSIQKISIIKLFNHEKRKQT